MTPDHARAQADQLDAEATEAAKAGDIERGVTLSLQANRLRELASLQEGNHPGIISPDMTEAQTVRRGHAVAKGKAKKSGHPVGLAIAASRWKTVTAYAEKRLKLSQSALSRYMSGSLPCPRPVADRVRADFGLDDGVWPKGVVD